MIPPNVRLLVKTNAIEAVQSLFGAKQRSILALLGVVIGVGSVIAMVSVGVIVQNEVMRQFREMGTEIVSIRKENVVPQVPGVNIRSDLLNGFNLSDSLEIPAYCSEITDVAPYATLFGEVLFEGRRLPTSALGVTESFLDLNKLKVLKGRFLSDLDASSYFCVVGKTLAKRLAELGFTSLTGEKIVFNGRIFTIIGELGEVPMGGMRPFEINEGIMIPVTIALRMENANIGSIMARLGGDGDWRYAESQIKEFFLMKTRDDSIKVTSAEELINQMQKQMQLYTILLGAIGGISLVVGGVGVMNVMLVSVSERKTEIGIRRALGAERKDIRLQFITESVVLCSMGGIIGIVLGIGTSWITAKINYWQFHVSLLTVLLGVGVSCAVGVFFGYYPARQASKLSPIEALRSN